MGLVSQLESLFRPKSIVVVGASENPSRAGSVMMKTYLPAVLKVLFYLLIQTETLSSAYLLILL